ncbi:TPA: lytic transglycosylase domain-containing protein [Proteus mirabilis]|uniref:lytic transglycosylase domain-containing protein n=1 Tax=Proteus mirabilis TaxID=584 RepID=UPI001FB88BAE|nr:lytic transglycosylase domain-containing protein [Proteus mirabilis]MCJ2220448.1 lytic transglycosylase domain-containing protein [Proteus mirabilis]
MKGLKLLLLIALMPPSMGALANQFYDDEISDPQWIAAMQSRWGSTTNLQDFNYYQQIQKEAVEEINQVIVKNSDTTYKAKTNFNASKDIKDIVNKYAEKYDISPDLVLALIKQESGFKTDATSSKGAKGLMQLMDFNSKPHNIDPYDPDDNVKVGTALLARLINKYGDIKLALAAYNAGEGAVKKYGGIPPYKETENYVKNIMAMVDEN